eukprot:TRINITY_DN1889_c0_g1_i1.p1 TRINITY_DN1889_c0_g1~~TRINITY_DN1889_c0_g1_i1.p1  ORF type:complete len:137 (-),score=26.52 TRINITY_DN1889_c0_g1_i1:79-489(-)
MKSKRRDKEAERRAKHNIISSNGRKKIKEQIENLKRLIPEIRHIQCTKHAILECASLNMTTLLDDIEKQRALNEDLLAENNKLREQFAEEKYKAMSGSPPPTTDGMECDRSKHTGSPSSSPQTFSWRKNGYEPDRS